MLAASDGYRASKIQDNTKWIGCTFKKSVVLLFIASLFGIWKLHLDTKIHHSVKQFRRETMMREHRNGFGGKYGKGKSQLSMSELTNMSRQDQILALSQLAENKQDVKFGKRDSRHL